MELENRCKELVEELGLATASEVQSVKPLTGGVASDIAMVDLGTRKLCVKFALPKLKVAAEWLAPVHRNAAEYAWLEVAAGVAPESAVRLFGRSEKAHGFAVEFLDGTGVFLWKERLLAGEPEQGEAAKVGTLLGKVHDHSAQDHFDTAAFQNRDDFHALRIEPYLSFTRTRHPQLTKPLKALEDMLYESQKVLVHGDASPKNIMFRQGAAILLDAECATMGDASFDPAFCLNHLALKAVHLTKTRQSNLEAMRALWKAYVHHVSWEDPSNLEKRLCALLPALMLARIDGKSPVEYLSRDNQQRVRDFAIPQVLSPTESLDTFVETLMHDLTGETQ